MASNIDETKPITGTPTTQSVRDNFLAAKTEIEALQQAVAAIPAGTDGTDGASAYEIWLLNGGSGTEQDFLASLEGAQGPAGPTGADGADGQGVPVGGATGQVLAKSSATDYATQWVDPVSGGDMLKTAYDTDNDGIVDAAESVPWAGVTDKPATYPPDTHGHGITDIVGLVAALAEKATPADIATAIAALVDSSPAALDTLNELAAALGDDPNFATTITNALAAKAAADHTHTGTYEPSQAAASQAEMEAGTEAAIRSMSPLRVAQAVAALGGGASLPVADTVALVKGSVDDTKLVRMEVDGLTTGTTRVLTVPDRDLTLAGTDVGQTFTRPQKAETLALTHNTAWDGSIATGAQHLTVNVNGSSFTIANPSAQESGMVYMVYVTYTTAHSIAWGTAFKGLTGVTATATAGAVDTFLFRSNGTNLVNVGYALNGGA